MKPSGLLLLMFGYKCDLWAVFKEVVVVYTKVVFDNGGKQHASNYKCNKNSNYPTWTNVSWTMSQFNIATNKQP